MGANPAPARPTGIGTDITRLHQRPAEQPVRPIPGLYHHPVAEPDPALVQEVDERTARWAVDEVQLVPPEWEEDLKGLRVGYAACLCHPDFAGVEHLVTAARMLVAENAVDEMYCEDYGGSPEGLGDRLFFADVCVDRVYLPDPYAEQWERSKTLDAPRRAYTSAMDYLRRITLPSLADREVFDLTRLHLAYLCEAAWTQSETMPPIWMYLAMRHHNSFRCCVSVNDAVAGFELPAQLHDTPEVQRAVGLAGLVATLCNDLYSYTKELRNGRQPHLNLPTVVAADEDLPPRGAYLRAVEIHNDTMHAFEAACVDAAAAYPAPDVARYLRGLAAWIDGNHHWHATNRHRYSLPDFWPD